MGAYRCAPLDEGGEEDPLAAGAGVLVVGEGDVGSYEDVVLYRDARGDEGEGPDLAVVAYLDPLLYVDEGVHLAAPAYLALVKVHLVVDPRAFTGFDRVQDCVPGAPWGLVR